MLTGALMLSGCSSATVSVVPDNNSPTALKPSTGSPAPVVSSAPKPSAGPVTILLTGELFWQDQTWLGAQLDAKGASAEFDFSPMLEGVKKTVSGASLAICHEEVPIAASGATLSGFPSYSVPPQVAPAIKNTGFDACTVNSAHALDQGVAGLDRTLTALQAQQIVTVGGYRTQKESATTQIVDAAGVKVAIVSGTESRGSTKLAADKTWAIDMLTPDAMIARAKAAKAAGAQIVIAVMHAGMDGSTTPTVTQRQTAAKLTASPDIDLVYGHATHTVQPIEKVNGKWVLYGLGNLVAQPPADQTSAFESIMARATFTASNGTYTVSKLEYLPTTTSVYSAGHPIRVRLTKDAIAAGGDKVKLAASLERVRGIVGSPAGLTEG